MNSTKRSFLHTAPEFALCGRELLLHVTVPGSVLPENAPELDWRVNDGAPVSTKMKFVKEICCEDNVFTLFSTTIPAQDFSAEGRLTYTVLGNDGKSASYVVPISREGKLPPFVVYEWAVRPKNKGNAMYMGVYNPNDEDIDLYDYKMMSFVGVEAKAGTKVYENMFSSEPGAQILHAKEIAVVRFIPVALHAEGNENFLSDEGFCSLLTEYRHEENVAFSTQDMRIIPVDLGRYDEESAKYVPIENSFEPLTDYEAISFLIVPRAGTVKDAVYTMIYDDVPYQLDIPVRRASTWEVDVRHPDRAVRMHFAEPLMPGKLHADQSIPDLSVTSVPQVLPLDERNIVYLADGDMQISFLTCAATAYALSVKVYQTDGDICYFDAEYDSQRNVWIATIPHAFLRKNPILRYTVTVKGNFRTGTMGASDREFDVRVLDNEGPAVVYNAPEELYASLDPVVNIRVDYEDISGVDIAACALCVDKHDVSAKAKWTQNSVTFKTEALRVGKHTYELSLRDGLGNKSYYKFRFSVASMDQMNCYRGEVHCHTGDSDGSLTPSYAIEYARDIGNADFFAVTDHSHHMGQQTYQKQIEIADKYNEPGSYAVLYGWEMTYNMKFGLWGHVNVLNTKWMEQGYLNTGLTELYEMVKNDPDAVAMFNHPCFAWGDFDEFAHYDPQIDEKVALSEIKGQAFDREYTNLLHNGWHAAPVFNEDNHGINWTTATNSTGYILAPALTRANVLEAFRARRTYSTSDNTMHLTYKLNGAWLGSRIKRTAKVTAEVHAITDLEDGLGVMQLVGEDGMVVAAVDVGAKQSFDWTVTVPSLFGYYYVRIVGKGKYTVTAPVWIDDTDKKALKISGLTLGYDDNSYKSQVVAVNVHNASAEKLTNIEVSYYLTAEDGPNLTVAQPYYTTYVRSLAVGAEATVLCGVPNLEGRRRVTAIACVRKGEIYMADTDFTILSPLQIVEIMPHTSEFVAQDGRIFENAYRYITLFNASERTINLKGYALRLWNKTGKAPVEKFIQTLDGASVMPHSTAVFWIAPQTVPMTAEDFNAYYGTSLVEGENLFRVEKELLEATTDARRVELVCGGEVLSRVHYNFGTEAKKEVELNKPLSFVYASTITGTSQKLRTESTIAPGAIRNEQKPAYMHVKEQTKTKRRLLDKRLPVKKILRADVAAKAKGNSKAKWLCAAAAVATTAVVIALLNKDKD